MSRPSQPSRPPAPTAYELPSPPTTHHSSRSAYPVFLSFKTLPACSSHAHAAGLWMPSGGILPSGSSLEIRANVLKSLLLNSLSLASIYMFDLLLFPLAQGEHRWLHRNVGWAYHVLWLLPIVSISLYLNSTWCTLIAKRTFTLQHGPRAGAAPPSTYTGLLNALATSAYGAIMVITSVAVSFALAYVPGVGPPAGFAFLCWVDAYYCFEHMWVARGLSLAKRVRHLEERWAYYFAFGFPSAALCMWGSSLANAALFALVFPAYIIMAMHAHPVPLDPYSPLPPRGTQSSSTEDVRYPHPLVPIRLPVFAPVMWLNDWVVRVLSIGEGMGGGRRSVHRRMVSDSAESIEEGEASELSQGGGGRQEGRGYGWEGLVRA